MTLQQLLNELNAIASEDPSTLELEVGLNDEYSAHRAYVAHWTNVLTGEALRDIQID